MLWAIIQRRQSSATRIAVALPELQDHQRRADFFAGQQLEMGQFLPGPDVDAASPSSRTNSAAHWPGQPTATITPWAPHCRLK